MFNFARLKSWLGFENLTNTDLNAEIDNIRTQAGADTLSGANSTAGSDPTVAAMQATSDPGDVGTEALAATVQADVKQLRYVIDEIIGEAEWYSAPAINLANVNTSINGLVTTPQSRIISGRVDANVQPMFLVPDGVAATIALKAATTNFVAYFNGELVTFSADLSVTGLSTAAAATNTCLVNDPNLTGGQSTKTQGERGTYIAIDTVGASITALNGTYAAFKTSTEYFIAEVDTTASRLKNCFRGVGFDSTDAWKARVAISDNDTITLMKLTWIFATYNATTPGLAVTYNKPLVSYLAPAAPAIGDYWYDIANNTWKTYSGSAWVETIAVFVGICIQDTANCVLARSSDFYHVYSILNTFDLEYVSATATRSTRVGQQCSVYGTTFYFNNTQLTWNTGATLDSGEALTASTTYYCYLTNLGDIKTSSVRPSERKFDLLGSYHPAKPFRCVGEFVTDASTNVQNGLVIIENDTNFSLPQLPPRNYLVNGDNDFAQRIGTAGSLAAISTTQYLLDRWKYRIAGSSAVVTISQDATVPTLLQSGWRSAYSVKIDVTTADGAAAAGDLVVYEQYVEGPFFRQIYGRQVTLSFWIRTGKVGTYCAYFQNNGNGVGTPDRSYIAEFTVAAADTWEKKIITATMNPVGGASETGGSVGFGYGSAGLRVGICLMGGSTYQTTAGAWQSGNFNCTSNQALGLDNTATNIYIAQWCLNPGGAPILFQRFADTMSGEEIECCRFYEKNYDLISGPVGGGGGVNNGSIVFQAVANHRQPVQYRVRKCKTPTVTAYNPNSGATGGWRDITAGADRVVVPTNIGEVTVDMAVTGAVAGNTMNGYFTAEAELV